MKNNIYENKNYESEILKLKTEIKELKKYKKRLNFIEKFSHEAFAVFDNDLKCIDINKRGVKLFGYSKDEIIGKYGSELIAPEYRRIVFRNIKLGKKSKYEALLQRKNGTTFWGNVQGSPIEYYGKQLRFVTCRDITEHKKLEEAAVQSNIGYEIIFNNAMIGILLVGKNRTIIRANQVLATMFGYDSPDELQGKSTKQLLITDDLFNEFSRRFYPSLKSEAVYTADIKVMKKDGTEFWIVASGKAMDTKVPADLQLGVIWSVMDITERKSFENELVNISKVDCLTSALNRRCFCEIACKELSMCKNYDTPFSLIFIDIDYFKKVNDKYGHAIGDETLIFFVDLVKSNIRKNDIFGRLGGEEFGISLPGTELSDAVKIIEKIRMKLKKVLPDYKLGIPNITISSGVVKVKDNENFESAGKRADELLYRAKRNGRDRTEF